ncbi:AEC family transporter [Streptomyces sp. AD681]|uniref:AEC family transporter n=1 Tax=Streptomyces sp. AD681 TaxID=3019069 RepID=UPI0022F16AD0|nr:AEC family transporter [Streptomyces sp. AD681]MDA5147372.1 AEC family transporter [Streptomyces sp. AD681]
MLGVFTGFLVISVVIGAGYLLARRAYLGNDGRQVLNRLAFRVATPCLLFTTLAGADLGRLISQRLLVTALATVTTAGVFIAIARLNRWASGHTTIGALCSSYVNAGNLGIPIAVYVLGDASLVAPVLLLQQILITPIALTALALGRPGRPKSLLHRLTTPLRNPMAAAALAGTALAATGWTAPRPALEPLTLIGNMSVPAVLMAFGMSLHGSGLPARGPHRRAIVLSAGLKTAFQPLVAYGIGATLFHLTRADLLDVAVIGALPAAQNLYTYASQYRIGERLARESILLSTVLAVPALFIIAALLG